MNDLPDDVICNVAIYANDNTFCSKCGQSYDLWQQRELVSEIENDLQDTVWAESGLLISIPENLICFHLTSLITLLLLMGKWMGLFLRKNYLLRCWGSVSLLNWIGALTLSLLLILSPRKLESWFVLWSFVLVRFFCISVNLPSSLAWHTVFMSRLVLLTSKWNRLDKLREWICRIVGPSLFVSLAALAYCQNVASLRYYLPSIFEKDKICSYRIDLHL